MVIVVTAGCSSAGVSSETAAGASSAFAVNWLLTAALPPANTSTAASAAMNVLEFFFIFVTPVKLILQAFGLFNKYTRSLRRKSDMILKIFSKKFSGVSKAPENRQISAIIFLWSHISALNEATGRPFFPKSGTSA